MTSPSEIFSCKVIRTKEEVPNRRGVNCWGTCGAEADGWPKILFLCLQPPTYPSDFPGPTHESGCRIVKIAQAILAKLKIGQTLSFQQLPFSSKPHNAMLCILTNIFRDSLGFFWILDYLIFSGIYQLLGSGILWYFVGCSEILLNSMIFLLDFFEI